MDYNTARLEEKVWSNYRSEVNELLTDYTPTDRNISLMKSYNFAVEQQLKYIKLQNKYLRG